MGCFNTVRVPCPECGLPQEYQSKAGDCDLRSYPLKAAPLADLAAAAAHGHYRCADCGTHFAIRVRARAWTEHDMDDGDSET